MSSTESTEQPAPPKRFLSAYLIYSSNKDVRAKFKADNPNATPREILTGLSAAWKALSADEQKPYQDESAAAKAKYEAEVIEYKKKYGADAIKQYKQRMKADKESKSRKGATSATTKAPKNDKFASTLAFVLSVIDDAREQVTSANIDASDVDAAIVYCVSVVHHRLSQGKDGASPDAALWRRIIKKWHALTSEQHTYWMTEAKKRIDSLELE